MKLTRCNKKLYIEFNALNWKGEYPIQTDEYGSCIQGGKSAIYLLDMPYPSEIRFDYWEKGVEQLKIERDPANKLQGENDSLGRHIFEAYQQMFPDAAVFEGDYVKVLTHSHFKAWLIQILNKTLKGANPNGILFYPNE